MTLLPIILQKDFIPVVSAGKKVAEGDLLAKKESLSSDSVVNVATNLIIPPQQIYKFITKNLGDRVEKGDTIAIKKGALGMGSKKVLSQFSGTIVKIDEEKGEIVVKNGESVGGSGVSEELISPVEGVVDFCNNEKIVIKTEKNVLIAEDSLGKEVTGELLHLDSLDTDEDIDNKIIVVEKLDKISLFKALGMGVMGIITKDLEDTDFIELAEKNIKETLVLVSEENFHKIIKAKNKHIYLNGENKNIVLL